MLHTKPMVAGPSRADGLVYGLPAFLDSRQAQSSVNTVQVFFISIPRLTLLFFIHGAAVAIILVESLLRTSIQQSASSAGWFLGWSTVGFCGCILHSALPPTLPYFPCTATPGLARCCTTSSGGVGRPALLPRVPKAVDVFHSQTCCWMTLVNARLGRKEAGMLS